LTHVATLASEFLWRPSKRADECATHSLAVAEARRVRDLFDRMRTFFQHYSGDLDAKGFDGLGRRLARLLSERARELTHAEVRGCSEVLQREFGLEILSRVGERR